MKTALDHFKHLYGDMPLEDPEAVSWIFVCGWNSAMEEAMKRVNAMPFGADTRASFAVYFQQMMHIDPGEMQDRMQ